jgi:preprotein translocase subunit SecA
MKEGIREETVGFLFNLEVEVEDDTSEQDDVEAREALESLEAAFAADSAPDGVDQRGGLQDDIQDDVHEHGSAHAPHIFAKGLQTPKTPQNLTYSAPSEDGEAEIKGGTVTNADDPFAGASRNAECPCGSGKKYKKCHGAPGGPTGLTARPAG